MKKGITGQSPLRTKAETQLTNTTSLHRPTDELTHELQIHQIELEMQNEELRQVHIALEESRDLYRELYDFAPVGYALLTLHGLISKINLTAAEQFGVDRSKLLNRRFAAFVATDDGDHWHLFSLVQ